MPSKEAAIESSNLVLNPLSTSVEPEFLRYIIVFFSKASAPDRIRCMVFIRTHNCDIPKGSSMFVLPACAFLLTGTWDFSFFLKNLDPAEHRVKPGKLGMYVFRDPQQDLAFIVYCWRHLSRPDIKSVTTAGRIGIGNRKNASMVSSIMRRISMTEGAMRSLFACTFHISC
uniref:Uncharacterized protein n=1 Tax=Opuntia streptacantha TaxID=393608 RepID=A0A7C9ELK3_OPUST